MKHFVLIVLAVVAIVQGCAREPKPAAQPPWRGETQSMAQVAAEINANNQQIPTLWARHEFEATVFDEKKRSHFVNGEGVLLYSRPRSMLVVGTKPAVGRVFEIGSTPEKYWLKLVPEADTMWYGDYSNLGKPCVQPIPIRPDLVFEVLGISTFNTNFSELPAPVMRFNNDADAYMFVWIVKLADRWVAQKEIWYDRATKLPKLVLLFDADGRVVLRAYLARHQPVEVEDVPREKWPKIATHYRLFFPDTGTKMDLRLRDMVLDKNGAPSRRGIVFPDPSEAGVSKVVKLDEACGDK